MIRNIIRFKPSRVLWIGEVPEHWKVWKVSNAFNRIGSGTTPDSGNSAFYSGTIPWVNTSELRENLITDTSAKLTEYALEEHSVLSLYPPGTLLIAMYGATIGRLGILGITACTNQACCALAESLYLDSKFCFYWFQMRRNEIIAEASGGGQKNINQEKIRAIRIPAPPVEEQKQIAAYLDRETIEIDALIAEKEHMLALIEEKREALISHAITHGLNPNVPLKSSGLDWLGDVPEHWTIERAKGLFREVDDRTTTGEEELLSLRMHVGLVPHHDVSNKILEPNDVTGFKKVETGQLVINRMRASMGLIAVSPQNGLVSPDYAVFDIVRPIHIPYFLALFNTSLVGALFRSASKGLGTGSSGFLRLYSESFLSIHFPVPPLDEQRQIVDFLDQERKRTGEFEKAFTDSITLLKERRSALITAAVTGQIEHEGMRG